MRFSSARTRNDLPRAVSSTLLEDEMSPIYTVNTVSSVSEAAREGRRVFERYEARLESLPQPIQHLVETLGYFCIVLQDVSVVLDQYREVLPQRNSFASKIETCRKFIDGFQDFASRKGSIGQIDSSSIATKTRDVVKKAFTRSRHSESSLSISSHHESVENARRCKALDRELQLDINKLLMYILLKALRRSVIVNDGNNGDVLTADERAYIHNGLTQPSIFGPAAMGQGSIDFSVSPDEPFEVIYRRLLRLRSMYERARNRAIHVPGATENLEPLRKLVDAIWHAMNNRVGQIARDLQMPTRTIFEGASTTFLQIMLELTNESQHLTAHSAHFRQRHDSFSRVATHSPTSPARYEFAHDSPMAARNSSISSASLSATNPTPFTSPFNPMTAPATAQSFAPLPLSSLPSHTATIALTSDTGRKIEVYLQSWKCTTLRDYSRLVRWDSIFSSQKLEHCVPHTSFPRIPHSKRAYGQLEVFFSGDPHHIIHYENGRPDSEDDFLPVYNFLTDDFRIQFMSELRNKTLLACFETDVIWTDRCSKKEMGHLRGMARDEPILFWQDREWPYRHTFSFFANSVGTDQVEYPVLRFHEAGLQSDGVRLDETDNDFLPAVPNEDEIEAAQMAPAVKVPKWLRIQFTGRSPRTQAERFVNMWRNIWREDQITRPKPPPPQPDTMFTQDGTRLPPELSSDQLEPQETHGIHIVPTNELSEGGDQLTEDEIPRRPAYHATPELDGSFLPESFRTI